MMDGDTEHIRRRDRTVLRLKDYDYSKAGGYFITICTHNRDCLFGEVINQEMWLNEAGEIVEQWWLKSRNKFSEISLDSYIIMPNHIHGIIMIMDDNSLGAIHELPLLRQQMLIPKTVGYFKMNSAKYINKLREITGISLWQRNYYERIIRNENELSRIREYIQNNPLKWDLDRENPLSKNFNLDHGRYWKEIYYSR
jgi:REP element-mobilizing transposase RayT